jgi:hypothetical protein
MLLATDVLCKAHQLQLRATCIPETRPFWRGFQSPVCRLIISSDSNTCTVSHCQTCYSQQARAKGRPARTKERDFAQTSHRRKRSQGISISVARNIFTSAADTPNSRQAPSHTKARTSLMRHEIRCINSKRCIQQYRTSNGMLLIFRTSQQLRLSPQRTHLEFTSAVLMQGPRARLSLIAL